MEAVGSFLEEGADKECVEVTGGGRHTTSTNTTGGEAAVTPPAQHGKKRTRTDEPMDCASDRDGCTAKRPAGSEKEALLCLPLELDGDHVTPQKLAVELARCLHEPKYVVVKGVVDVLGSERSIALFTMTAETQRHGGILTADGGKKRAPGGVFFSLAKSSASEEEKRQIFFKHKKAKKKAMKDTERRRKETKEHKDSKNTDMEQEKAEMEEGELCIDEELGSREHPPDRNMERRQRKREVVEYTDLDNPVDQEEEEEEGARLGEGWRNDLDDDGGNDFALLLKRYEQLKRKEVREGEGKKQLLDEEVEKGERLCGKAEPGLGREVVLEERLAADEFDRTDADDIGICISSNF